MSRIAAIRSSGVPISTPPAAVSWSSVSSGVSHASTPTRCNVPTVYSLCQRCRPCNASARACSLVSAMCQFMSTRQLERSMTWPCLAADSSAKLHCNGSAARPAVDIEPIDRMPMPYFPASVMPDGLTMDATVCGISPRTGRSCSLASYRLNQSHS